MEPLSDHAIEEVLVGNGVGVLSLVHDGHPYGIPMSFGYDGNELRFVMQFGTGYGGHKMKSIRSNSNACFTVYEQVPVDEHNEAHRWRSVIATGEVIEVDQDIEAEALASLVANAEFPPDLGIWGVEFEQIELSLFRLDIQECSGREYSLASAWD